MQTNNEKAWSPYLAGSLTGLVIVLSAFITGQYFGVSTTFARSAGMIGRLFSPERFSSLEYFVKYAPTINWQLMFVIGIGLGSFLSAATSHTFKLTAVPDMWEQRFGPSRGKRALFALSGGAVALFGARLAGGWPSGHGLSGSLQMSVSSIIATVCFFVGGMIVARFLYGKGGRQ